MHSRDGAKSPWDALGSTTTLCRPSAYLKPQRGRLRSRSLRFFGARARGWALAEWLTESQTTAAVQAENSKIEDWWHWLAMTEACVDRGPWSGAHFPFEEVSEPIDETNGMRDENPAMGRRLTKIWRNEKRSRAERVLD